MCFLPLSSEQSRCITCEKEPLPFPHRAYGLYQGMLKNLLYQIKYQNNPRLARELGRRAGIWLAQQPHLPQVLTAVPLHLSRQKERGYNQATEIAKGISRHLGCVYQDLFVRQQDTPRLAELSPAERQSVLSGAFSLSAKYSRTKGMVLIVDDIVTTGATLRAMAACLPETDRARFQSFSLARAQRWKDT